MRNRREILKLAAAAAVLLPQGARAADADLAFAALLERLATDTASGAGARLAALRAFDPGPLSFEARLDYDGIAEGLEIEAQLAAFPFGVAGATILPYVVNQRLGAWTGTDAKAVADETRRIESDAAAGVVPPDFILAATLAKLDAARAAAPPPLAAALAAQSAALTALRAGAAHDAGVWRLPNGAAYYALALKAGTSLDLDPETAHAAGLEQVRDLSARAEPLLRKQGLTQGTIGARLHALAQDSRHLYSDDAAGRAEAVADMNAQLARVRPRLDAVFTGLSPGAVSVQLAGPGKIGYREAPSYDGSKPGAYYVDLRDIARRPAWSLPTVVHHETLPGHLLQLPLQERAHPPALRLRYAPNAFFEGWAIYAEELAVELGLLEGDDLAELGFLQSLLVRAARLVVDTGIHAKRWSREAGIARFADIAGDAPDSFENEVDRIVVQPGFTAGPALGRAELLRHRTQAMLASAGLKIFHDTILKRGPMRLTMLERVVRASAFG